MDWVTAILELNSITIVAGDAELRGRVQLMVTPGIAFQLDNWNLRAGVQAPVVSARTFDVNVLVIATWSF